MKKKGKPPTHLPVLHVETGNVYSTYTEAAKAMGVQSKHKGQHFIYVRRRG